jgi:hypothetical protein
MVEPIFLTTLPFLDNAQAINPYEVDADTFAKPHSVSERRRK